MTRDELMQTTDIKLTDIFVAEDLLHEIKLGMTFDQVWEETRGDEDYATKMTRGQMSALVFEIATN